MFMNTEVTSETFHDFMHPVLILSPVVISSVTSKKMLIDYEVEVMEDNLSSAHLANELENPR